MNWFSRKLYLYYVTFGLYALDWWECYTFNTLVLMLLWFICSNTLKTSAQLFNRYGKHQ